MKRQPINDVGDKANTSSFQLHHWGSEIGVGRIQWLREFARQPDMVFDTLFSPPCGPSKG
jgi:hypothetical protein